ncbi:MAG: sulfotransferase [Pseudomonadota bacterium]
MSDYSFLERLSHRLALGNASLGEVLMDLESSLSAPPPNGFERRHHVFVSGLARAGTTALMRALHASDQFASLTYRDMPFVLAPNLGQRFRLGRGQGEDLRERAHGDGVMVNIDSPEALEEPFWRSFCGRDYIKSDRLVPHLVEVATLQKYRTFVGHVLSRYERARYLAKNNNAMLRLPALIKALPNATIVIPFRDPVAQSISLHRQHARFAEGHDAFTGEYMRLLGHHEFGPDHRPFVLGGQRPAGTPDSVNYWLSAWVLAYAHMLKQATDRPACIPVAYEQICAPDRKTWTRLSHKLAINPGVGAFNEAPPREPAGEIDPALLRQARHIYQKLAHLGDERLSAAHAGQTAA